MRQELNKIAQTAFYMKITAGRSQDAPTPVDEPVEDQVPCEDDETRDDVSIPIQKVKKRAVKVSRRKRKPAVPVLSDSDNDSGVEGYEGIALVNGEVKSVAPTRKSGRARTLNSRFGDPNWMDNNVTTSEDESE